MRSVLLVVLLAACGDDLQAPSPDAPPDAGTARAATGTHLVTHEAFVAGITSDGYVAFYDFDANGHSVAKVVPLAGGPEISIATSDGTGKQDVRFEIRGTVVFAWTDRGNRVATLTIWSKATGAIAIGPNTRPGRAAATADGAYVLYQRDVTTTTAAVVAGPIAGAHTMLASGNAEDLDCWQDVDLAAAGDRFLARFCPGATTAFTLRSYLPDGTGAVDLSTSAAAATYGARVIWLDGAKGVHSALPDGSDVRDLAAGVEELTVARDGSGIAYRTTAGAIFTARTDGSAGPVQLLASGAVELGAMSPDQKTVLYATRSEDKGTGFVQPYYDVAAATAAGSRTLVAGTTSCPSCLADNFTADSRTVLVLDPIDNSQELDAAGTIRTIALDTGATAATFGGTIYTAIGIARDPHFLYLAAVRDAHGSGWIYTITERGIGASDATTLVADGAQELALDAGRTLLAVSFADQGDGLAGIWTVPLGP